MPSGRNEDVALLETGILIDGFPVILIINITTRSNPTLSALIAMRANDLSGKAGASVRGLIAITVLAGWTAGLRRRVRVGLVVDHGRLTVFATPEVDVIDESNLSNSALGGVPDEVSDGNHDVRHGNREVPQAGKERSKVGDTGAIYLRSRATTTNLLGEVNLLLEESIVVLPRSSTRRRLEVNAQLFLNPINIGKFASEINVPDSILNPGGLFNGAAGDRFNDHHGTNVLKESKVHILTLRVTLLDGELNGLSDGFI